MHLELATLPENRGIAFSGDIPTMSLFVVGAGTAERWIERPALPNPGGQSNRDVLRPLLWASGREAGIRSWVIDFGVGTTEAEARRYRDPFDHVDKEIRIKHRAGDPFWRVRSKTPDHAVLERLPRYVATSLLALHRLFVWASPPAVPAEGEVVFARDDDAFFGVLHSRVHRAWAPGHRYTPEMFETFPFP